MGGKKKKRNRLSIKLYYLFEDKDKNQHLEPYKPTEKETKPPFKLPLKNGGHRWNIYRVPNFILNGKQDGSIHGGLVLDEKNDNVMLAQVTHSPRKGKRTNIHISNLDSSDIDPNTGLLKDSYIERRLIVSTINKNGIEGITAERLNKKLNDLEFTQEEKQQILNELSNLSTAEDRYNLFIELANKKGST